ncbi:MAG: DUF4350 domain-containing protein [Actinomycetota bacterium]
MSRRNLLFWIGLVVALVAIGYLSTGRRNDTGRPLDPDSTDGLGTLALIELLERFETEVTFGLPTDDTATTLIITDQLTSPQRQQLQAWADDGGAVVVVDPASSFAAEFAFGQGVAEDELPAGQCTIDGLETLTLAGGTFLLQSTDGAEQSCFGDAEGAYVNVRPAGDGRVVSLGGGLPLSNQYLDEADNAVLAVEVLLPTPEGRDRSVAVLYDPVVTPGSRSLIDLVSSPARWTGAQLLVAFAVYVLWRSRRFGRPVTEPQPVKLPGSLLVRATGELQRRAGGFSAADQTVRADHERRLRRRLKVAPELPAAQLVSVVATSADVENDVVERSLVAPVANDKRELVALVQAVDTVTDGLDRAEERSLQGDHP